MGLTTRRQHLEIKSNFMHPSEAVNFQIWLHFIFHVKNTEADFKSRKCMRSQRLFFSLGAILKTTMAFRFFHKMFMKCISSQTFLKTKFPKAQVISIIHHYNNYAKWCNEKCRIWPLWFHDKCNFYLKLIYTRIICNLILHILCVIYQVFNSQLHMIIPLKGYHQYKFDCKNSLPVS